jgi:hypothetical protein
VLAGGRKRFRCEYVCDSSEGHCAFTFTIAGIAGSGAVHAVVTRENASARARQVSSDTRRQAESRRLHRRLLRTVCSLLCLPGSMSGCWLASSRSSSPTVKYSTRPANRCGTSIFPATASCVC